MNKNITGNLIKVLMLTGVFFLIINYFGYFLSGAQDGFSSKNSNKEKFTSNDLNIIGNIGVAISTNIGTRHKQTQDSNINTYKDIVEVGYILSNQKIAKDKLISANMMFLGEYFNILKTDIRGLLASSNDREFALNSFIAQLEYRYKNGIANASKLNTQKQELKKAFETTSKEIENIKQKIGDDFGNLNEKETKNNIDVYLDIKQKNTNAQTYIVFIDKFLNYYNILNSYNKKVLDTLINNKEVLIKNSQVVIPDTGGEILKQLKLLYDEKDWKAQN
ncbi:hypothetical protein H3C61_03050 [Candidatus Gracilibacteria bacterium]|nr:hypothetical protein [Candidatus Gracilibacteria bacterium]